MNIDDPKLTAFALDELGEPERSTIANEVARSPEAQRVVDETRELARLLKNEFAAELNEKAKPRLNLSDIRDDPWFWGIGRPLAIAASVAVFGLLSAILIGTYSRRDSEKSAPTDYIVQAEQNAPNQLIELPAADRVPNPLSAQTIKRVERVVIGEINVETRFQRPELRVIETINDGYRIERLKQRLAAPAISRETKLLPMEHSYGLVFLDHQGQIVASARFCRAGDSGFV
ncbi:MAG TPA: hypothetical protein VH170_07680, partial [Chthoniobacterales bacterium]|nr:hypothetical protein [Chthoniobacterales bacterium]